MVERRVHVLGSHMPRFIFISYEIDNGRSKTCLNALHLLLEFYSVISKMKFQGIGSETWFQFLKVVISKIFVKFHSKLKIYGAECIFSFTLHIYLWFDVRKYSYTYFSDDE